MGADAQTWAVGRRIGELAAQAVDRGGLWIWSARAHADPMT
jgi:hypothetical protein